MSEKSEEPTPRRLRRARNEGDSPISGALVQGAALTGALLLVPAMAAAVASRMALLLRSAIGDPEQPMSAVSFAAEVMLLSLPVAAAAALTAATLGFVQTGGVVAFKKISPDFERVNPFAGIKQLITWQRVISIVRALVAAMLVGYLAVRLLVEDGGAFAGVVGNPTGAVLVASRLATRLAWFAALIGLGLAVLDVLITRRAWFRRHRMSKDEVKREYKETEGDPEIKAARQRAHQEILSGATIAAVRDASVLIVNPTHRAVALRYVEEEDEAPRVVAQGLGDLARRMIEAAHAYGVPVVQDVPIAHALAELETGDEIPETLYEAVAEILREVWAEAEARDAQAPAEPRP